MSDEFEEVTDFKKIGIVIIIIAVGVITSMYFLLPDNFEIPDLPEIKIELPSLDETQDQNEISIPPPNPEQYLDDPLYKLMIEDRENEEAIQKELQDKTEQNRQIAVDNNEPNYFDEELAGYVNNELFTEPPPPEQFIMEIKPNYEKFIGT